MSSKATAALIPDDLAPWRDRLGRFSPTRLALFLAGLAPAAWLLARAMGPGLGAEPLEVALNETGHWAVRFLLLSLAISPLRVLWSWPALAGARRMVGLTAFGYAFAHLTLYTAEEDWRLWHVGAEIASRLYLAIGFAAVVGLAVLAATSFDRAIRWMGPKRWRALHRLVYLLAPLALAHYWLQVRLQDYVEPLVASGLLALLFAIRLTGGGPARHAALAALAVMGTALGEAAFLWGWFGAPPGQVLMGNFSAGLGVRPAWWVAMIAPPLALFPVVRDVARDVAARKPLVRRTGT